MSILYNLKDCGEKVDWTSGARFAPLKPYQFPSVIIRGVQPNLTLSLIRRHMKNAPASSL
jgi:hypothetical protein